MMIMFMYACSDLCDNENVQCVCSRVLGHVFEHENGMLTPCVFFAEDYL